MYPSWWRWCGRHAYLRVVFDRVRARAAVALDVVVESTMQRTSRSQYTGELLCTVLKFWRGSSSARLNWLMSSCREVWLWYAQS